MTDVVTPYTDTVDGSLIEGQACKSTIQCQKDLFCYKGLCAKQALEDKQFCDIYFDGKLDPNGATCLIDSLKPTEKEVKCYLVDLNFDESKEQWEKVTKEVPCADVPDDMINAIPTYLQTESGDFKKLSDAEKAVALSSQAQYYCQHTRESSCFDENYVCSADFRIYRTKAKCDSSCAGNCDSTYENESYIRVIHTSSNVDGRSVQSLSAV